MAIGVPLGEASFGPTLDHHPISTQSPPNLHPQFLVLQDRYKTTEKWVVCQTSTNLTEKWIVGLLAKQKKDLN